MRLISNYKMLIDRLEESIAASRYVTAFLLSVAIAFSMIFMYIANAFVELGGFVCYLDEVITTRRRIRRKKQQHKPKYTK